jgi:O-antigen/teichoic acid export membrane protein
VEWDGSIVGARAATIARGIRQLSALLVGQTIAVGATLSVNILLARQLQPAGFGTYSLVIAVAAVLAIPLAWTTSSIVVFGQEDTHRYGRPTRTTMALAAYAVGALVIDLLALWVGRPFLIRVFPEAEPLAPLMFAYVLVGCAVAMLLGVFQARHELHAYSLLIGLAAAGPLFAVVALSVTDALNVSSALTGVVAGQGVAAAILGLRLLQRFPGFVFDARVFREVGTFVASYSVGAVVTYVLVYADVLVLGLLLAPTALGEYSMAARIYLQLLVFVQLFGTVALPIINRLRVEARDERVVAYLDRRLPQALAATTVGCSILAGAGPLLIPAVFGRGFAATAVPFVILMAALALGAWRRLLSPVVTAYRLLWEANVAALVSAAVLVLGLGLAVPTLGGPGAALAVVLSVATELVIVLRAVRVRLGATAARARLVILPGIAAIILPLAGGSAAASLALVLASLAGYVLFLRRAAVFRTEDTEDLLASPLPRTVRALARSALFLVTPGSTR